MDKIQDKIFPEGMDPLGKEKFHFNCHSGVSCFTDCCKNVNMILYPFDIVQLKKYLAIDSSEFLEEYVKLVYADNPYFPTAYMKLTKGETPLCPFLGESGCGVYNARPSACRTYPLQRAIDKSPEKHQAAEYYFLTHHLYCKGHFEEKLVDVKTYIRSQYLDEYNMFNDLWGKLESLLLQNPFRGNIEAQKQVVFMACYNIDEFKRYLIEHNLLKSLLPSKEDQRNVLESDKELLKFSLQWATHYTKNLK